MSKFVHGWKPDLPDHRDFQYVPSKVKDFPRRIDLRDGCPPVYDQGTLGSCTANAINACIQFEQLQKKDPDAFMPSRLFVYYNEREMEGTVMTDSGAMIRDGIKSVNKIGVCKEKTWPYNINKFATKPPAKAYEEALNYKSLVYASVQQDLNSVRMCLMSGDTFVFGFSVYSSFDEGDVAKTGIMRMPSKYEKLLGGHAVLAVGYDDDKQHIIVRNSWGTDWGDRGYFYMPYEFFFTNLTSDFWSIKDVAI